MLVFFLGTALVHAAAVLAFPSQAHFSAKARTSLPYTIFSNAPSSATAYFTPALNDYIASILEEWESPGLSVAIVRKDKSVEGGWRRDYASFGIATEETTSDAGAGILVKSTTPVTPSTMFAIASNSKLFLSCSVGLLIENNTLAEKIGKKLEWTTKLKGLIPQWGLMDKEMEDGVSIQDALSHKTGMPRHDSSGQHRAGGVPEMISLLRYLKSSQEFRSTLQYNNLMFETLTILPSLLLNMTYYDFIQENMFDKLGMASSTFSPAKAEQIGTLADGFFLSGKRKHKGVKGVRKPQRPYFQKDGEEEIWAGAGGVIASATDLSVWLSMLMNSGRHPLTNSTIIPEEVIKRVRKGVSVYDGEPKYPEMSVKVYGMGQSVYSYRGREIVEHGGSNPVIIVASLGFKTQVARFPNDNLGIIVLSNDDDHGSVLHEIIKWRVMESVLGLDDPVDWNARYKDALNDPTKNGSLFTPRPANATVTIPSSLISGQTFHHPTYGSITPCLVPTNNLDVSSQSVECNMTLSDPALGPVLADIANYTLTAPFASEQPQTFIAPINQFFSTHMRFTHFAGSLYNVTQLWTNLRRRTEEGYPLGGEVVHGLDDDAVAQFWEDGFGMYGNFWGAQGDDHEGVVGTKDGAEVWFDKI